MKKILCHSEFDMLCKYFYKQGKDINKYIENIRPLTFFRWEITVSETVWKDEGLEKVINRA